VVEREVRECVSGVVCGGVEGVEVVGGRFERQEVGRAGGAGQGAVGVHVSMAVHVG